MRFQKFREPVPVTDPAMDNPRTHFDGTTQTTSFLPHALRKQKNPTVATAIINKDPRVISIMEATEEILSKYKQDMSANKNQEGKDGNGFP
jgi:hypothetical protein